MGVLKTVRIMMGGFQRRKAPSARAVEQRVRATYDKVFAPNEAEQFSEGFSPRVLMVEERNKGTRVWFQRNYGAFYDTKEGNLVILAFIPVQESAAAGGFDLERTMTDFGLQFRCVEGYYRIRLPVAARPDRVFGLACRYFNWSPDSELNKTYCDTPPRR
jgi:hypothetical protein